jgi:hypothetical protein
MRTFYIFKITKEYYKLTEDIPFNLYSTYLSIKLGTQNNLPYLYKEFFSFTELWNKKNINFYLYQKLNKFDGYTIYSNTHMFNNYYTDEVSKLIIKNSYLILKSNKENSTFFTILSEIPNLFVIDFENKDYFWLSKISNLRLVYQS